MSTKAPPAPEEKTDGRRERTKRTRVAIVAALTELLDEGQLAATAADIAERAGVAVRSIGQHFASREELLLAVAEHHAARLPRPSIEAGGTFEARLERFVEERASALEASRAMRRAAAVVAARSPAVTRALERAESERRKASAQVFGVEIAAAAEPEPVERAVALIASGRAWDELRTEMKLRPAAAKRQLRFMLREVLAAK